MADEIAGAATRPAATSRPDAAVGPLRGDATGLVREPAAVVADPGRRDRRHPALHGAGAAPGAGGGREERPVHASAWCCSRRSTGRGRSRGARCRRWCSGSPRGRSSGRAEQSERPGLAGPDRRRGGCAVDPAERYRVDGGAARGPGERSGDRAGEGARAAAALGGGGCWCVVLAGLAAYGVWYGTTRGARLCRGGEERARRGLGRGRCGRGSSEAFGKTGRPYAQDTFERVARVLDGYARGWVAMRRDACEATHVRGEQSEKLLDLRMQCLERRLGELRALTALLATRADAGGGGQGGAGGRRADRPGRSARTARRCSPRCRRRRIRRPRRRVEAIRKALDEVAGAGQTGKYQEGLAAAEEARAAAGRTGYRAGPAPRPCCALGALLEESGRYPEAEQRPRGASLVADACGHTEVRARALNQLLLVVGVSPGALTRTRSSSPGGRARGGPESTRTRAARSSPPGNNFGIGAGAGGDYEGARRHFRAGAEPSACGSWAPGTQRSAMPTQHIGDILYSGASTRRRSRDTSGPWRSGRRAWDTEHPQRGHRPEQPRPAVLPDAATARARRWPPRAGARHLERERSGPITPTLALATTTSGWSSAAELGDSDAGAVLRARARDLEKPGWGPSTLPDRGALDRAGPDRAAPAGRREVRGGVLRARPCHL